jgi:glycosyltransferase involved in cell wall biosynthesis
VSEGNPSRPLGLSAFVRCKNEEEYIVASLMSIERVCDEVLVVLNNSTDGTRALVEDIARDHPKIRILDYPQECSATGPGYDERVRANPESSLALYYNWCLDRTRFSHVCKWDGDMIATPEFDRVKPLLREHDVVMFDGWDVLAKPTTDFEARIFRYDPARARYMDWDLYEVLNHDYSRAMSLPARCYLHMKLVKREWLHREWSSMNELATRSVPETGAPRRSAGLRGRIGALARKLGLKGRPQAEGTNA